MLVCLSDACVCTIHGHHEEARAALMRVESMLMRVESMHDWTRETGPRMNDDRVKHDWNTSLCVRGLGSAVHTWT